MDNPLPDRPRLRWPHPFLLLLLATLPGAQLFTLAGTPPSAPPPESTGEPTEETRDNPPEFSTGFHPSHLDNDVYWEDDFP